jgi:glutamate-1-semialdehyde aminotransferase
MTKEEMAREWVEKYCGEDYAEVSDPLNRRLMRAAYLAGYDAAIAQASEGFQDYFNTLPEDTHDWFALKNCYQAARLSAQKEIEETFSLTTVIKDGVFYTQSSTNFYFKKVKELEAKCERYREALDYILTYKSPDHMSWSRGSLFDVARNALKEKE